jgi:putative chitobiose transport system permease protein
MRLRASGRNFLTVKRRQTILAYCFLLPSLAVLGVFIFYPMFEAFRLSLFDYKPLLEKRFIGAGNFRALLGDENFWRSLGNSVKYLLVVPVIIVLSLGLALLVEPHLPGMNFFRASYYVPVVTTMVVVGVTWKIIFHEDFGLLNHILRQLGIIKEGIPWLNSVTLALYTVMTVTLWKGLGYYMVIFLAALRTVPQELIEASMIDGARKWQQLLFVKVPMLWPAITLVAIISSISALQVFDEIYVMTGGKPLHSSSTLVFYIYEWGVDPNGPMNFGYAAAMGLVLFALLIAFTVTSVRLMQRGSFAEQR